MSLKVVEVQLTPNPNARKFVLSGPISEQTLSFFNREATKGHEIAEQLFVLEGVTSVMLLGDFVTVNKTEGAKWGEIVSGVKKILEQHRTSGR